MQNNKKHGDTEKVTKHTCAIFSIYAMQYHKNHYRHTYSLATVGTTGCRSGGKNNKRRQQQQLHRSLPIWSLRSLHLRNPPPGCVASSPLKSVHQWEVGSFINIFRRGNDKNLAWYLKNAADFVSRSPGNASDDAKITRFQSYIYIEKYLHT